METKHYVNSIILMDTLYEIFQYCSPKTRIICKCVCKQWQSILITNADVFFRNSRIFLYMCKVPLAGTSRDLRIHYRRNFNQHIMRFLKTVSFHQLLTGAVLMRKHPREICRDLFWYIPNPTLNYRTLTATSLQLVKRALKIAWRPFFSNSYEVYKTSRYLSYHHHNTDILYIYLYAYTLDSSIVESPLQELDVVIPWPIYKTTLLLNNLIWIFLLINIDFTPAVISEQFPYGIIA